MYCFAVLEFISDLSNNFRFSVFPFQLPKSSGWKSSEIMEIKVQFLVLVSIAVLSCFAQDCGKVQNINVDDKNNNLPWIVQFKERSTNEVFCIGTLISNRHVLVGMTSRLVCMCFFDINIFLFSSYQRHIACGQNPTTRNWKLSEIFTWQSTMNLSIWWTFKSTQTGSSTRKFLMQTSH